MSFVLERITQIFPHFNERPITEAEFWRACKRLKICVREIPLPVDGYYERYRNRDYIILNSGMSRAKWLHTALHEFCHYLFDVPVDESKFVFFRGHKDVDPEDPREKFANAFALIGIMPFPEMLRISREEDLSDNPWLLRTVAERIAVRAEYRM